jgi:hypothetical protein
MTWRLDDELYDRVRHAARAWGWSVNEYVTRVMDAATDPSNAEGEVEQLRERLSRAGLLVASSETRERPDPKAVARARKAAGRGVPLSQLVGEGRE